MDKLAKYKLDKAFTTGVNIPLDHGDSVALVRLPSKYHRPYNQALFGEIEWKLDEDGAIDATSGNILTTRFAQEDAFINHCILSIDGEPAPDNLAEEYPDLLQELMQKADELAADIDTRVDDSVKKSLPSSAGKESGPASEGNDSMPTLNAQAG